MIRSKRMLVMAGLFPSIGREQSRMDRTSGKGTSRDVNRDVDQADKTTAAYAKQNKEEYQQQLDTRLKGLDAEIAKLREKNGGLQDEAKAEWERTLPELQSKRDSALAKLTEVYRSSD